MSLVRRLSVLAAVALAGLALATAGLAAAAEPRWVIASVNARGAMAVDLANIETVDGNLRAEGWIAFPEAGPGEPALYAVTVEFNCDKSLRRFVRQVAYDRDGEQVGTLPATAWSPAEPGSNAANTEDVVCGRFDAAGIALPADRPGIRKALVDVIARTGVET